MSLRSALVKENSGITFNSSYPPLPVNQEEYMQPRFGLRSTKKERGKTRGKSAEVPLENLKIFHYSQTKDALCNFIPKYDYYCWRC